MCHGNKLNNAADNSIRHEIKSNDLENLLMAINLIIYKV